MEQQASLMSLLIVIVVAFLTPIILHRFRLQLIPVVVAEIIMGLVIGKSGLNIIQEDMWLETLSTLGFIFLMFLSGLEIDFTAFTNKQNNKEKKEPHRLGIAITIFAGIFVLSLLLSYLFVLAGLIENVFLMTLIISTISLGVVVPTLKEANIMQTSIGQIILLIAVIADLVTMILLAVFVSVTGDGDGDMWLLLILFAVGIGLYFVGRRFKNKPFIEKLSTGTVQIGTRAIFTLIIVLVVLSESVGAENILGAFLAGVLVSLLAPNQELIRQLDSFGYGFFIPIFFVMVGVDLDLWSLLTDKKLLLLIPLLLLALLVSKLLPVLILRKWFDRKTVLAAAFLLTSTLSLVIAAAKIAERMGVITPEKSGTFILVAVISCIVTPIVFKKLLPKENSEETKVKVALVGANQLTLPVSKELASSLYEPQLYHTKIDKTNAQMTNSAFHIVEMPDYEEETLKAYDIFSSNIVVFSTGDEERNATLALSAKMNGVERVIARAESPDLGEALREEDVEVFSGFLSNKVLLRALIESPNLIHMLTNEETSLYEIEMLNHLYDGMTIRRFPFTGDVIFVRIVRGADSIVPHGDTELHLNDKLIVTGTKEYVDELKRELEFPSF